MTEVNNSTSLDNQDKDLPDKFNNKMNNSKESSDDNDKYLVNDNNTGGSMIYFSQMSSLQFNNYLRAIGRG